MNERKLELNQLGPSRGDYVTLKDGRKGIIVGFGLRDGNTHDFIVKIPEERSKESNFNIRYVKYIRIINYLGVTMIGKGKWKETSIFTPDDVNEFIKKTKKEFAKCPGFSSMSLVRKLYYKLRLAIELLERN